MKITILSFFLFFLPTTLFSQLLPFKKNNQWGFINTNGNVVIPASYEAVNKTPTALLYTVQQNGKLGLVNHRGETVLSCQYDYIKVLGEFLFRVADEKGQRIISSDDDLALDLNFTAFLPFDRGKIKVQQGELWGVINRKRELIIPVKFKKIEPIVGTRKFYKFSNHKEQWGIISDKGEIILEDKFEKIQYLSKDLWGIYKQKTWGIINRKGAIIIPFNYRNFRFLRKNYFILEKSIGGEELLNIRTRKKVVLQKNYDRIKFFNNNFIAVADDGKWGLIDTLGFERLTPNYANLIPTPNQDFIRIQYNNKFGIYDLKKDSTIIPMNYDWINLGDDGVVYLTSNRKTGLYLLNEQLFIPAKYDRIAFKNKVIKSYLGQSLDIYTIDEQTNTFKEVEHFPYAFSLKIGYDAQDILNTRQSLNNSNFNFTPRARSPYSKTVNYKWVEKKNGFGLIDLKTKKITIKHQYFDAVRIVNTHLAIVYDETKRIKNTKLNPLLSIISKSGFYAVALFDLNTGKFLTDFDFCGILIEDFESNYTHAACIDKNGAFKYIDGYGTVSNESYAYLSPLSDAKRIYVKKGTLEKIEYDSSNPNMLATNTLINSKYKIRQQTNSDPAFFNTTLSIVLKDSKRGFLNENGSVLTDTIFEATFAFKRGRARTKVNNKWGLIDTNATIIIPNQYAFVLPFDIQQNSYRVGRACDSTYLLSPKGNVIIDSTFQEIGFHGDNCFPFKRDGLWGYVDINGKEFIPPTFDKALPFSNGTASVKLNGKSLFVDKKGLTLFESTFDSIGILRDGLATFMQDSSFGYIDKEGKIIIPAIYDNAFAFHQGVARIVANKKTGLINTKGEVLLAPEKYLLLFPFNKTGVAPIKEKQNGYFGLVNLKGEIISPLNLQGVISGSEGITIVKKNNKLGAIDTNGKWIIKNHYDFINPFHDGWACIKKDKYEDWRFINKDGDFLKEYTFFKNSNFNNGFAVITIADNELDYINLLINAEGKQITFENKKVLFSSDGIHGLENNNGQKFYQHKNGYVLNDAYFKKIEPFQDGFAIVQNNNRYGLINHNGLETIFPKYFLLSQYNHLIQAKVQMLIEIIDQDGNKVRDEGFDYLKSIDGLGSIYRVEKGDKIGYINRSGAYISPLQN